MATVKTPRQAVLRAKRSEIISALNHPIRRSSLRLLLEKGPTSATQIAARMLLVTRNNVRFRLDSLVAGGMAKRDKRADSRESVYTPSEALRAPWIVAALKLTAGED